MFDLKQQTAMTTLYEKACKGQYLEKFAKKGELLRTAEQYPNGNWVVKEHPLSKTNLQGEYTEEEFKKVKRYF